MKCRALLLVSCLLAACHARREERAAPRPASAVSGQPSSATALAPVPSAAAALPLTSAVNAVASPPGIVFEVAPMVQVKHKTDGQRVYSMMAEPGVLLGPKRTLLKAFDCVSKGAPHADMFGVCVAFKACEPETPTEPSVLYAFSCTGPALRVLLVQEGRELTFKVADPEQALAKRAMSRTPLPEGATVALQPFVRKNLTAYVDL